MATPTPQAGDDATAAACLELLRSGTNGEKITARLTLAEIFERRGQYAEAVELLETNRSWGFEDCEMHESLARLYRHLGRPSPANKAERRAAQLRREIRDPGLAWRRAYWIAGTVIACGVAGTIASYWLAVLRGGGRYVIFYGMIVVGVIMLFRIASSRHRGSGA
jgi:hypothetical protein